MEVILKIKDAEAEAKRIREEALQKKQQMLQKARDDAQVQFQKKKDELDKAIGAELDAIREAQEKNRKKELEKNQKKEKDIDANAKKNLPRAVDFILDEMERLMD